MSEFEEWNKYILVYIKDKEFSTYVKKFIREDMKK